MASARKPMASDSPRATTPRTTGSRSSRCFAIADSIGRCTWAMAPFGFRTATDQFEAPRIITPSRAACPPIVWLMARSLSAPRAAGLLEPPLEALDAAAGIEKLLLARIERVAVRADLDVQLGLRRTGLERVPAGAGDGRQDVLGMDASLHRSARIATAASGATLPPETSAATFEPRSSSTFPARSAAAVAAPATSQASFIRPYMKRKPSFRSSSVTRIDSTPRAPQISTQLPPA